MGTDHRNRKVSLISIKFRKNTFENIEERYNLLDVQPIFNFS